MIDLTPIKARITENTRGAERKWTWLWLDEAESLVTELEQARKRLAELEDERGP